jgi:7-carboxy-7-deazaguanine synthase
MNRLRITEIFYSLQGESLSVGRPTLFIRLTGCPLRCTYCDTAYAFSGGDWYEMDAILDKVAQFAPQHVCVTGGEPLAQRGIDELLERLCDAGYQVSLETSGALDIRGVDSRVSRVVDIKTPASGESDRNLLSNFAQLTARDQIKFVIGDESDYHWSRSMLEDHQLHQACEVLFSPVHDTMDPGRLADWVLRDRLPVRFQLQLHKLLWGEMPGR